MNHQGRKIKIEVVYKTSDDEPGTIKIIDKKDDAVLAERELHRTEEIKIYQWDQHMALLVEAYEIDINFHALSRRISIVLSKLILNEQLYR